ncbi:MAG: TIGR04076 family protein [Acidobacteriota bacterium]
MPDSEGRFELYDLQVVVEKIEGHCTCAMQVGDRFQLRSGKLSMPDGSDFCLYALQATIPLLPAKQRLNHPSDWLETDSRVVCPDPACRLTMRIDRTGTRRLHHDEVSAVPMEKGDLAPRRKGAK